MIGLTPAPKPHRSIGIMVIASLMSATCGVVLTFCIPRLLPVEAFGLWRAFLLYAGYAGLLHFGLIDGALLLWSRQQVSSASQGDPTHAVTGPILNSAMRFIMLEHFLLLVMAGIAVFLRSSSSTAIVFLAIAVYALLFNFVALLQVYFQTRMRFGAIAFGMCAPPVLFVVALGILALSHATLGRLLLAYLLAWAITFAFLSWVASQTSSRKRSGSAASARSSVWRLGLGYIAVGWPIVLANTGFGVMQSADRITVNLTRPLHDFAIYSLSQSTVYVPITILAAISRVAFSWFAQAANTDRAALYRSSTRLLSLLWAVLLPYFFVVDYVVRRFLPRYVPGLPAGLILLLSVLFLSLIQIVQLNTYSLEGRQRQFFVGSLLAVALAFATAWMGAKKMGSLPAVAWSQVLTAGLWWLGNEWFLHDRKLMRSNDIMLVIITFAFSTAGIYLVSMAAVSMFLKAALYYCAGAIPIFVFYRSEIRDGWKAASKSSMRLKTKH